MAKDGTARGGARMGSGPKRKALTEKISAGKAATIIDLPEATDLGAVNIDNKKHIVPSDKLSTSSRKNNINCLVASGN